MHLIPEATARSIAPCIESDFDTRRDAERYLSACEIVHSIPGEEGVEYLGVTPDEHFFSLLLVFPNTEEPKPRWSFTYLT